MSNGKRIIDAMHDVARLEAIRTHARSILEEEGQDEGVAAEIEHATRIICSSMLGGYCQYAGGDLGCRNGRGDHGPHLCVAKPGMMFTMQEHTAARAVVYGLRSLKDSAE